MSVGTPPFRILDDYAPYHYPSGEIHYGLKFIIRAIQEKTACEINEEMLRYAVTNEETLPQKTRERMSQLKRVIIQDKVDTFWPTIFRIFYPSKRDSAGPLTITLEKNSEMSLELDWNDLLGFEQIDEEESFSMEEAPLSNTEPISAEGKELYRSFELGDVNLSASEKSRLTPAEIEEDALLKQQHLFLETLGRSIFATYVNDAIPLITKLITDTFKDKELLDVLAPHLQSTILAKIPKSIRNLPVDVLRDIISGQMNAFENSLGRMIDDEQKRRQLGLWIEELLKDQEKESQDPTQAILVFLMEQYVPDILHGVLGALRNSIVQKTFDPMIGTLLDIIFGKPIENGINVEELISAAEMVLQSRLNEFTLRDKLMESLHPLLIKMFFPDPVNIDEMTKNVLTSILFQTEKFFEGLNQATATWDTIKGVDKKIAREEGALNALAQKVFTDATVPLGSKDVFDAITLLLQEILAKTMFSSPSVAALKPREKCVVILLSKIIHNAIKPFCSVKFINVFLVRIFDGKISPYNPYDKPMPPTRDFDASDTVFSNEIDIRINRIATQVINLAFTSRIAKKGAKTILDLIPKVGETVQKTLNKIFNSGTTLMPGIFAAQFLFKRMPEGGTVKIAKGIEAIKRENQFMRQEYIEKLKLEQPYYDLSLMKGIIAESQWVTEDILGKKNTRTKEFLKKMLPFGTQGQTLKLIKKIYGYAQHDLFIQLLLVFILRGVSDGLGVPKKK